MLPDKYSLSIAVDEEPRDDLPCSTDVLFGPGMLSMGDFVTKAPKIRHRIHRAPAARAEDIMIDMVGSRRKYNLCDKIERTTPQKVRGTSYMYGERSHYIFPSVISPM